MKYQVGAYLFTYIAVSFEISGIRIKIFIRAKLCRIDKIRNVIEIGRASCRERV